MALDIKGTPRWFLTQSTLAFSCTMATSRNFFSIGSLNSSDDFVRSNRTGSDGHRSLMEMSAPRSLQGVHPQQMFCVSNRMEIQRQGYTMLDQERLRRFGAVSQTFLTRSPVGVERYFRSHEVTAHMLPPMMPQQYAVDGRLMRGFTQTTSIAHVGGPSRVGPAHLAALEHTSSNTIVGYHHETLKRKAVITELPHGLSAGFVVNSTTNKYFGFAMTRQEELLMHNVKKNRTMELSLVNRRDDNVGRVAREIQFFPQSSTRGLPRESEFSAYEISSSSGDGPDVALDLSLKLSSSNGGSNKALDLSLNL
ncbi:hypothetical protein ACP70R_037790 [Stipagrostis hirtigluma subsp. patula]